MDDEDLSLESEVKEGRVIDAEPVNDEVKVLVRNLELLTTKMVNQEVVPYVAYRLAKEKVCFFTFFRSFFPPTCRATFYLSNRSKVCLRRGILRTESRK